MINDMRPITLTLIESTRADKARARIGSAEHLCLYLLKVLPVAFTV
jgi:hypothetical protein